MMFRHSFLLKRASPLYQLIAAFLLAIVAMLLCRFFAAGNAFEYSAAFIGIVFFALINAVVSIFHPSFKAYTLPSYLCFFLLTGILLRSAKAFTGISIWSLAEYRFMFTSVTIFYLTTSVLVRVIRGIYEFAENEDVIE